MTIRVSNEKVKLEERYAFAKGCAFAVTCMIDYFRFKQRSEKLAVYLLRRVNEKLGASFREVLRTGQLQQKADELQNHLSIDNPTSEQKQQARTTIEEVLRMRRATFTAAHQNSEGAD
jgi:hypothetical protein